MQHAMKLVMYSPKDLEYKEIIRNPTVQAKAESSLAMKQILRNRELSDEAKINLYRQQYFRYQNVKGELDESERPSAINTYPTAAASKKRKLPVAAATASKKRKLPVRRSKRTAAAVQWRAWK